MTVKVKSATKLAVMVVGLLLLGFLLVHVAVNERLSDLQLQTEVLIAEQKTTLVAIAEATARNGADAVTERIIRDCTVTERTTFDDLLSRLNRGLQRSELVELERLFGRCGSFYAERKAVMVARLQREFEIYTTFVSQLSNLSGSDMSTRYNVSDWQLLAEYEQKQSDLFNELVVGQDDIISTLLSGKQTSSPEIVSILETVQGTQQTLMVTNAQINELRAKLIAL